MVRRILVVLGAVVVLTGAAARPASAQQFINLELGGFYPWSEGARSSHDVLLVNRDYLLFDISNFRGWTGGGDWGVALGDYFEVGVGAGYYQRTVATVYADWVNDDGSEIRQDLSLRIVPVNALVRILPFGQRHRMLPYVGGGVGFNFWRYSESGEFVDFYDNAIFRDRFVASGTAIGPVAVFGLRSRVTHQVDAGMELRYVWAEANLPKDFLSDRLDLGGYNILANVRFRF
jgi:opacity protein-like surface antigen